MNKVFAPALRQHGLKGSAGHFELSSDLAWALLGFQKSTSTSADRLLFTVNLTVVDKDDWNAAVANSPWLGTHPKPNFTYRFAQQERLGRLLSGDSDRWWEVRSDQSVDAVRNEVLAALSDVAVPWLTGRMC